MGAESLERKEGPERPRSLVKSVVRRTSVSSYVFCPALTLLTFGLAPIPQKLHRVSTTLGQVSNTLSQHFLGCVSDSLLRTSSPTLT